MDSTKGAETAEPEIWLSRREESTLKRVARGASNREIARDLDIPEAAVKVHLNSVMQRFALKSREEVAGWARRHIS
jgi:two-component system, NarL family, nitrate/nitrite response regulator NarL